MESPAQDLDEQKLDAAIAGLMGEQRAAKRKVRQLELPVLRSQEDCAADTSGKDAGFASGLRQRLAELSGAA